jgi:protein O-mannosyl-transferase
MFRYLPITMAFVLLFTGCAAKQPQPTQKELAHRQWDTARANVLYGLARDQYQAGNFARSRQSISEALRLNPNSAAIYILSAKLAIEEGQLEAADKDLIFARHLDPKNAEADYLRGIVHQRWQKLESAHEFYQKAMEKAPSELAYVLATAETLVSLGRSGEAVTLLQRQARQFEHNPILQDVLGQLLMQEGRHAEAAEALRRASLLATDDLPVREHLAIALFRGERYRESADVLGRLLGDARYAGRADLLTALGECQLELGRPREARSSFEAAVNLNATSGAAWLGLSRAALQLNDLGRAETSVRRALALEPTSSQVYLMLGFIRLKQERLDEALSAFQKSSALDAGDSVSLCLAGFVLEKLGRPDQAIEFYARAVRISPADELALSLLAGGN